jgi:hypothetical protein
MNNFTKEDLENLRLCVAKYRDGNDEVVLPALFSKIQGAIEDYIDPENCPHYWLTDPKLKFMSNPPKYNLLCSNCGITRYMDCAEFDRLNQWGVGR